MKANEIRDAIEKVADAGGAKVAFTMTSGGRHNKAWLTKNGRTRFVVFASSPGKTYARKQTEGEARRAIRALTKEN